MLNMKKLNVIIKNPDDLALFVPYEIYVDKLVSDAIMSSVRLRYKKRTLGTSFNGITQHYFCLFSMAYIKEEIYNQNGAALFEISLQIQDTDFTYQPSIKPNEGLSLIIQTIISNIFSIAELIPRIAQTKKCEGCPSETYKSIKTAII